MVTACKQGRQALIVVEPEAEELAGLEKGGNAVVGFEHARDRPDEKLSCFRDLGFRRPGGPELLDLRIDRGDGALDVVRIDPCPDEQGAGPTVASKELYA